jgi:UDPglucose 6-dehydrogenase
MDILIAGYGFVGIAHEQVLKQRNTVHIYDPRLGYNDWWKKPDGVIICVSTPPARDGSCDVSNVIDVLEYTDQTVPVLIKSTISLEGWAEIRRRFPQHQLAFSPEFLRAETAVSDFQNTRQIYIGGMQVSFWHALFRVAFDDSEFVSNIAPPEELILAKYFRNSFLAAKVAFFNQVYDLCEQTNTDYDTVANIVGADSRIGHSHTQVTQERGYGGHCFPKDVEAVVNTADEYGVWLSILEEVMRYNKDVRGR